MYYFFFLFGGCRYSLVGMRKHIKKRPPLATTEKVQQFVRVRGSIRGDRVTCSIGLERSCLYTLYVHFMDCLLTAGDREGINRGGVLPRRLRRASPNAYEKKRCSFWFGG